ncbi:MAG: hypothetical protein QNJ34_16520, partial [Xenococcaceae cyanobacterium MO_188.B29]|nr:hypothetical protein [Xenococcaceae cyanobacterium MO_188.B29]
RKPQHREMSVGEINLKSCLRPHFPHFPHSLIPLSFQAYPNSIGAGGRRQEAEGRSNTGSRTF